MATHAPNGQGPRPYGPQTKKDRPLMRGEKALGGVCSGIAAYFDTDAIVVRVAFVALVFLTAGLIIVPYIALCIVLPKAPVQEEDLFEVNPVSAQSDRYNRMATPPVRKGNAPQADYALYAGAGHVPPAPPMGASQRCPTCPPEPVRVVPPEEQAKDYAVVPWILGLALFALFLFAADSFLPPLFPGRTLGLLPLGFIAAGVIFLAFPPSGWSFVGRVSVMLLFTELAVFFLPFTLGLCPFAWLGNMGLGCIALWLLGGATLVAFFVRSREWMLAVAVAVFAVALVVTFAEVGVFARIEALYTYSHHNQVSPLLKKSSLS